MSKEYNPEQGRGDRLIRERVHDPYMMRTKPHEPSVCRECGVVFSDGRWQWAQTPGRAEEVLCPACQRLRDRYPAGHVHLGGEFFAAHREEILNLVENVQDKEKGEHPLNRIMAIEDADDGVDVTTTDIHLARRIGDAVHAAYEGDYDYHYTDESQQLQVTWRR